MNRLLLSLLLIFGLTACDRTAEVATSPEDAAAARQYIELLRTGQFDQIVKDADPALSAIDVRAQLVKMAEQFPAEEPTSIKILRARITQVSTDLSRNDMAFEYLFPSAPVLVSIALHKRGAGTTVAAFSALRIPEHFNDFTLSGRNALQYTVLALAVLVPLFTLYALVVCLRTKLPSTTVWHRWAWVLAIVFSLGRFSIDWMTGVWTFQPVSLLLFGVGAMRSLNGYGPWVLTIGLPVGAAAFLIWHRIRTGRSGDVEISRA